MTTSVKYNYADQFARLEAMRAYLKAAAEIASETLDYERRKAAPSYVQKGVGTIMTTAYEALSSINDLMSAMETDLAIENGQKETLRPPPVMPGAVRLELKNLLSQLVTIDDPFIDPCDWVLDDEASEKVVNP